MKFTFPCQNKSRRRTINFSGRTCHAISPIDDNFVSVCEAELSRDFTSCGYAIETQNFSGERFVLISEFVMSRTVQYQRGKYG